MDYTNETINDILTAVNKVQRRVSEIDADNLSYADIKYIRVHLMSALSDTGELTDDLLSETVKDKYGDFTEEEDLYVPRVSDDSIGVYIEAIKEYRGHEVRVILYPTGCRCGYVKLANPIDSVDEIMCHGGITFNQLVDDNSYRFGNKHGHWIGFDCAHIGDAPDRDAVTRYFPDAVGGVSGCLYIPDANGVVRSTEYVLRECYRIVDQLIDDIYNK